MKILVTGSNGLLGNAIHLELNKSNIPTDIDKDIDLKCYVDTLGKEGCKANVIKGPKLDNNYVDCAYLDKYLKTF